MEVDLRQHEDGSFFLEIRHRNLKKEVDITEIIRHIVVDKLKELQAKLQLEERYSNWMVESAQETNRSLSTVATRYESMVARLKETDKALLELADAWEKGRGINEKFKKLEQVAQQNRHFLENDSTMENFPKS